MLSDAQESRIPAHVHFWRSPAGSDKYADMVHSLTSYAVSDAALRASLMETLRHSEYVSQLELEGRIHQATRLLAEGAERVHARSIAFDRFVSEPQPSRQRLSTESTRTPHEELGTANFTLTGTSAGNYAAYLSRRGHRHRSGSGSVQ